MKTTVTTDFSLMVHFHRVHHILQIICIMVRDGIQNSFCYNITIILGKKVIVTFFLTLLGALKWLLTALEQLLTAPDRIFGFCYIFCFVMLVQKSYRYCYYNVIVLLHLPSRRGKQIERVVIKLALAPCIGSRKTCPILCSCSSKIRYESCGSAAILVIPFRTPLARLHYGDTLVLMNFL